MKCGRCGGPLAFVQGQWWCDACKAYAMMAPVDPARESRIRNLLFWSRLLGWGGLGVMLLGPVGGAMIAGVAGGLAVFGLGFVSCVTGAVIGQVARGMQGRVI